MSETQANQSLSTHASSTTPCCEHELAELYALIDSQLSDADAALLREHIKTCSPCLAEVNVEQLIKALVRRSCTDRAPEQLRVRVRQQITVLRAQIR
jgi:mycothiol system anti-sigma-R factor